MTFDRLFYQLPTHFLGTSPPATKVAARTVSEYFMNLMPLRNQRQACGGQHTPGMWGAAHPGHVGERISGMWGERIPGIWGKRITCMWGPAHLERVGERILSMWGSCCANGAKIVQWYNSVCCYRTKLIKTIANLQVEGPDRNTCDSCRISFPQVEAPSCPCSAYG